MVTSDRPFRPWVWTRPEIGSSFHMMLSKNIVLVNNWDYLIGSLWFDSNFPHRIFVMGNKSSFAENSCTHDEHDRSCDQKLYGISHKRFWSPVSWSLKNFRYLPEEEKHMIPNHVAKMDGNHLHESYNLQSMMCDGSQLQYWNRTLLLRLIKSYTHQKVMELPSSPTRFLHKSLPIDKNQSYIL